MTATGVLTLSCPQRPGITHAVTSFLLDAGLDIVEHHQFDDAEHGRLFLRTAFTGTDDATGTGPLAEAFGPTADRFSMTASFHDRTPPRLLVMVSRLGHCLNDLVFRWRAGSLGGDITLVVSNHEELRPMAEAAGLPFVHVPVSPATKPEAEARLLALVGERGVKLVGATAHYVTPELDEGPIIEQEVMRVDHTHDPRTLARVGQDSECLALARAVRWHCEHRVLLHAGRTVVLR